MLRLFTWMPVSLGKGGVDHRSCAVSPTLRAEKIQPFLDVNMAQRLISSLIVFNIYK